MADMLLSRAQPAARQRARGRGRTRQRGGAQLGHSPSLRLCGRRTTSTWANRWAWTLTRAPSCRARASPSCAGQMARLHRALGAVHAGRADAAARLHRVLHALHRQRARRCAGTGQLPKFEGRPVCCQKGRSRGEERLRRQAPALYLIPTSRSHADQLRARCRSWPSPICPSS